MIFFLHFKLFSQILFIIRNFSLQTLLLKYQERHMKWHETLSDDRYSFCCSHCPQVIYFYCQISSQQLNMNRNLIVIFAQKFKDSKHLTLHLTSIHPDDYPKKSNTARENKLPAFHNAFLCNSEGSSSQQPISNKSAVKVLRNNQIL